MARPRKPLRERFDARVQKTSRCWLWTGHLDRDGYGQISLGGGRGRRVRAHAAAWLLEHGALPAAGTLVLHRCDNPRCVRPDHLFLGSQADNIADMDGKGRRAVRRGEDNPASKLTPEAVRAIRSSTAPQSLLAKRFGVSQSVISEVRNRKTWSHVA